MDGWIKLHRKIRNNEIFNNHQLLRLWIICLTEATHKERDQIVGKQTVHLLPGQFVTGRFDIADLYNKGLKPSDRVKGEKTVFRWLENLNEWGFLSLEKTNKFTVVTIDKWEVYQSTDNKNDQQIDQEMTSKRPTNDQQMTTNKNVKNDKKKHYAENVLLTEKEYEKLCLEKGSTFIDECIDYLSKYKIEKGYKSKSDNLTIRRWVIEAVSKRNVTPFKPQIVLPKPSLPSDEEMRELEEMARRAAERNRASNQ